MALLRRILGERRVLRVRWIVRLYWSNVPLMEAKMIVDGFLKKFDSEFAHAPIRSLKTDPTKKGAGTTMLGWANIDPSRILPEWRGSYDPSVRVVSRARAAGATDKEIAEYWDRSILDRWLEIQIEDCVRVAFWQMQRDRGLSEAEAAAEVWRTFPMYGYESQGVDEVGEERLRIPHELRRRISRYSLAFPKETLVARDPFKTLNAYFVDLMKRGKL
jgi:hypothetical protein